MSILMSYEKIPESLKNKRIFCLWKLVQGKGKVPYQCNGIMKARTNHIEDFGTFEEAIAGCVDGFGIGFLITENIVVCDLDHCMMGEDILNAKASNVVAAFSGSYIEKSPSGTGLHIIMKVSKCDYSKDEYYIKHNGIEMYIGGMTNRFMTLTGNYICEGDGSDKTLDLQKFMDEYMKRPVCTVVDNPYSGHSELTIEEVIAKAHRMFGNNFDKLFHGKFEEGEVRDASSDDYYLMIMLARVCDGDVALMDTMYRESALRRTKWDEVHGAETYGAMTIRKALMAAASGSAVFDFSDKEIRPEDYTDAGNAKAFVNRYGDNIIFTDGEGFAVWDNVRFDNKEHLALKMAMEYSKEMLDDASDNLSQVYRNDQAGTAAEKHAKEYLKHALYMRSATGLNRMLDLVKPLVHKSLDELDNNPDLLVTPTAYVDLRTGKSEAPNKKYLCTKTTATGQNNDGHAMWQQLLDEVTGSDKEYQQFLQCVAGMILTGKVMQEVTIFVYGKGRNGKSTLFNALLRVLGEYAGTIDVETLTTNKQNKGAALATLRGKRFILASELEEGRRLSTSTLKAIVSTDRITAERKYKAPESFIPTHTLVLFTNYLPRVGSTDEGTWRRILVCPFNHIFSGKKVIQNYADVLFIKAGGAILTWAIEGAKAYYKNGCCLPRAKVVEEITAEYRKQEDWLSRFLDEECDMCTGRTPARDLYMAFRCWSTNAGEYVRRENEFARAMEAAGFETIKPKNKKHYLGIELKAKQDFL